MRKMPKRDPRTGRFVKSKKKRGNGKKRRK